MHSTSTNENIVSQSVIFVLFFIWGMSFILGLNDPAKSFLHLPNLVFHEAGHILFIPFGRFMTILGGSLFQLMVPAAVAFEFYKRGDYFGSSLGLWWLGQSFIDLTPYIGDAKEQKLILLGGHTGKELPGSHDWNNILGDLNLIDQCGFVAGLSFTIGSLIMIYSFYLSGQILLPYWKAKFKGRRRF